jgi:hypothetical protein
MTEAGLADYCEKLGHDTTRVVTEPDLGAGTDDSEIVAHALTEDRLLVTCDDDFLSNHNALDRIGVLFQPNDRMASFRVANTIDAVAEHVDQATIVDADCPFHLTDDWL